MLVHVYVHVLPCAAVLYKANLTRGRRSGVVAEPKILIYTKWRILVSINGQWTTLVAMIDSFSTDKGFG